MKEINSLAALRSNIKDGEANYLLLYKSGSSLNTCAFNNVKEAADAVQSSNVFVADVQQVRDIHPFYGIDSVPSFVELTKDKLVNNMRGCNTVSFYKNILEKGTKQTTFSSGYQKQPRVTVYSTPTCSYCITLKSYLKQHQIYFTDIDISKDPQVAQALVQRSGRQGVPQTDIDGTIVVGFDKTTINKLLKIHQ